MFQWPTDTLPEISSEFTPENEWLASWWLNQPIWNICSSNWIISPGKDRNEKSIWVATTELESMHFLFLGTNFLPSLLRRSWWFFLQEWKSWLNPCWIYESCSSQDYWWKPNETKQEPTTCWDMGVSENRGPPKSSIKIGFSISFIIHFGVPVFLETPIYQTDILDHN